MTYQGPSVFRRAVSELAKLPGIGEKTACRLVFFLVQKDEKFVQNLALALNEVKTALELCSICFGYTDQNPCPICSVSIIDGGIDAGIDSGRNHGRDSGLICVVEDPSDLFAIERSGQYQGVYHVLHGKLAPLDGVGPEDLKVSELLLRVETKPPREVILATNPDLEGDATALYLAKLLGERGIHATRIAMGIPMGGHLEYTDQVTLGRAIVERREFQIR